MITKFKYKKFDFKFMTKLVMIFATYFLIFEFQYNPLFQLNIETSFQLNLSNGLPKEFSFKFDVRMLFALYINAMLIISTTAKACEYASLFFAKEDENENFEILSIVKTNYEIENFEILDNTNSFLYSSKVQGLLE